MTTADNMYPGRQPGISESVAIFATFARRYPLRTLLVVVALAISGVAEGLSVTLLFPVIQCVADQSSATGGRMGEWIFRLFGLIGLQPSLLVILLFMVGGLLLKAIFFWLAMNQVGFTIALVAKDLRLDLIRAILRARWSFFVSQQAGRFANAIAIEANHASAAYQHAAVIVASLIQASVYVVLALILSWKVAIASAIASALFVLIMRPLVRMARESSKHQVRYMKSVAGRMVDILHGLKPVKAMSREDTLLSYLAAETERLDVAHRMQVKANVTVTAAQEPMLAVAMAIGLYCIASCKIMPFSEMLVQAFLFSRLFNQVNQLVLSYQRLVISESSYLSLHSRIEDTSASRESTGGMPPPSPLLKEISFRNVSFAYADKDILKDVSMEIPARKWTALIGPSGSGKTTLSDLVAGLQIPQAGLILLDGVSIREVDIGRWRRQIGYVPQEMFLLHDTVFANVSLGEDDIGEKEVVEALCKAGAREFVEQLPDGIQTVVGERGARLSGGQRQRIALARSLVRNPQLLILDEASASLDPVTEEALCNTLVELRKHTTILAISHQPAFARAADRVYRVEGGGVILERGCSS